MLDKQIIRAKIYNFILYDFKPNHNFYAYKQIQRVPFKLDLQNIKNTTFAI